MKVLRIILMALAFISLQAHAKDGRNLAVNQANNAVSEQRIALVIGNSKYKEKSLANPANDARDMAVALRELGFDVIDKIDVTQKEMNRAIALFGEKLNANTIALFYYAGHGMQVRGKNYLIPVDAEIAAEASVRAETVDVDTVLDQLNRSPLSIVILDACRNNPFERRFRSTSGGLAAMDAPKGTLIAYATSPGSVASDGTGRNGLYTQELLKAMRTNGLPVERMFKEVRRNVTRASGDTQTPWEMSSLTGEFYFKPSTQVANMEPITAPVGGGVSLDDIKKQQESRGQWDKWQAAMKADFDKIAALNADLNLQITAWDRFLANYTQKNPFSGEDEQLRAQAQNKKQAAQAQQQQEAERQRQQAEAARPVASSTAQSSTTFRDCPGCPEMVVIPAGSFEMGSNNGGSDEEPVHRVTISRTFAIGKTEITRDQFAAFVNATDYSAADKCWVLVGSKYEERSGPNWRNSGLQQDGNLPVVCISWNDAKAYTKWLSSRLSGFTH